MSPCLTGHNKLPPNGPILSVHHCVLLKEDGYFQSQAGAGHSRDAHTSGELCGTDQNTGQRVSSAFFAPEALAHSPRTSHEPTALGTEESFIFLHVIPLRPSRKHWLRAWTIKICKKDHQLHDVLCCLFWWEKAEKKCRNSAVCYEEAGKKHGSHTFIVSSCLLIEPYLWIDAVELQNQFMSTTFVGCQEKHSVLLD